MKTISLKEIADQLNVLIRVDDDGIRDMLTHETMFNDAAYSGGSLETRLDNLDHEVVSVLGFINSLVGDPEHRIMYDEKDNYFKVVKRENIG